VQRFHRPTLKIIQPCRDYYLAKGYGRKAIDNNLGQHKECIVNNIDYFKLQAKNLHKDWKIRGQKYFVFNIKELFRLYNIHPNEEPTLMKAQHLLALALGRNKWSDLLKESDDTLAYTKKVLEQDRLLFEEKMMSFKEAQNEKTHDENIDTSTEYHWEVECLHCGQRFLIDKPNHLPSCDGEDWDLIPIEKL
jgi:hypothetical protein